MGLSAVVITYNEEANIDRCLSSLSFCDEIIVLDSFSTDATVDLARKYTDKVSQRRFTGFSDQKSAALAMATQDWVLVIDADEVVPDSLATEIRQAVAGGDCDAYRIPRLSYFLGRPIRHCGWYPDHQLRLAKRARASFPERLIHETLVVDGPVGILASDMLHFTCVTIDDSLKKAVEYSKAGARQRHLEGRRFRPSDVLFSPGLTFLKQYVLKRGFLDGMPGLVICGINAASVCLKYSALYALELNEKAAGTTPPKDDA